MNVNSTPLVARNLQCKFWCHGSAIRWLTWKSMSLNTWKNWKRWLFTDINFTPIHPWYLIAHVIKIQPVIKLLPHNNHIIDARSYCPDTWMCLCADVEDKFLKIVKECKARRCVSSFLPSSLWLIPQKKHWIPPLQKRRGATSSPVHESKQVHLSCQTNQRSYSQWQLFCWNASFASVWRTAKSQKHALLSAALEIVLYIYLHQIRIA